MNLKEKNNLIESFRKHIQRNHSQAYYTSLASQVYNSQKPENVLDFNSYSRLNWHWFFTQIMNQELHPKKVPLWEQSMFPWKKY